MEKDGACLVCGKPLKYFAEEKEMTCSICGRQYMSNASCEDGHYVCDECHGKKGIEHIMSYCSESKLKNPLLMAQEMMKDPYIYMHGNEHHVLVGAALLTAYYNAGGQVNFAEGLEEMRQRGSKYPGGSCGFWGCCGAAVSVGMFLSIVTKTTPLSGKSWSAVNQITANALGKIGELSGPRCCKRNSFTAIIAAVKFVKEKYGIAMELPDKITCEFYPHNKECTRKACPYFGEH